MSQLRVRSLLCDLDYYNVCRQAYSMSRVKWVTVRVPRWFEQTFPTLEDSIEMGPREEGEIPAAENEAFRILSVGCGAGEFNHLLLDRLLSKFPAFTCTLIEPARKELEKYEEYVNKNSEKYKQVDFNWFDGTLETYYEANGGERFNLIECVETMYYLQDYEDGIQKMYDSLAPNGVLIIILAADNAGYHNLWKRYGDLLRGDSVTFVTAADVKDALRRKNIPFTTTPDKYRVDITEVFQEDSEVGDNLLDFMTQLYRFRQSVPKDISENLLSLLKSEKCSESDGGRIYFNNSLETIVVKK